MYPTTKTTTAYTSFINRLRITTNQQYKRRVERGSEAAWQHYTVYQIEPKYPPAARSSSNSFTYLGISRVLKGLRYIAN